MNILALDLGTKTGWAIHRSGGQVTSRSASFALKKNEGPGQRWLKFRTFLNDTLRDVGEINAVYYEDVVAHGEGAVYAAHVYGGFLAMAQVWCEANHLRLVPVSVGTVKKHWTGKGNANKAAMIAMARQRGYQPGDDNEADALAILDYALHTEGLPGLRLPDLELEAA